MPRKYLIVLFFLVFVGARHTVPLQGLSLLSGTAFAQLQDDGQPCPPECVTDSMEIVTWYPSPYNEYEELRLYPISDSNSQCNSDTRGLMYYDSDEDKVKLCKGPAGLNNWQDLGGGAWEVSGNNIYNTNSGSVGIGTTDPERLLHINSSALGNWPVGSFTNSFKLRISGTGGTAVNGDTTAIEFFHRTAGTDQIAGAIGAITEDKGSFAAGLAFATTNGGIVAEKVRISAAGNIGIGVNSPQSALDVNGGIRTKQGYGAIQQTSNSVPFSSSYVNSHDGETHVWVASAPDLKDGSHCGSGPNAGYRFFDRFSVKGQYIVTLHNDAGTAKIHGQWAGGRVGMKNPSGSDVTDGTGSVSFSIFWDGSSWRLDNMVGSVGNENISCF